MESSMEWLTPAVIWFIIGFILLLLEFQIPGVVTLFFGIGAWIVALIYLFIPISINLQLLIFIISSVVLLLSLRKRFKTLFEGKMKLAGNDMQESDDFLGKHAVVTQKITKDKPGKVEFRGSYWTAEALENIEKGANVEIIDKNNITLTVKSL